GRFVAIDANLRPAIVPDMAAYRASVMAALGQAHLVKVSDDDLVTLGFTAADPLQAARELLQATPATWLALTLGPRGAVLLHRDGRGWQAAEPQPVRVADTVGAGDCFLAGLLAALLERPAVQAASHADHIALDAEDARHILGRAVASASLCVMQTGCAPPSLAEVVARVAAVPPVFEAL
uniref:PfkB family carbohydrate kinase n=1 Tax=Ramlibacter sp. TaxID=1917967 RepID=UPI002FCA599C